MYFTMSNNVFPVQAILLSLLLSTLAGCVGVPAGQESAVVTRAQMQMGTLVKITAVARSESVARAAATAGFAEIRRLEELLSTWIPTSESPSERCAVFQKTDLQPLVICFGP